MNTAELKSNLHRMIVETDDLSILDKIQAYFTQLKSNSIDWWDMLSETDKKNIEKGQNQLQNGNKIPHELVRKRVNNLLEKE